MRSAGTTVMRAAVLSGFAELTRKLGGNPVTLLRQAGLDTRVLIEPDLPIPSDKVCNLLEMAAIETDSEDFGLRLAQLHDIGTLGPIGMLAREERSVGEALQTLADYLHLHNTAAQLTLHRQDDGTELAIALKTRRGVPTRQGSELITAAAVGVLRRFLGADWHPLAVSFTHPPPRSRQAYQRVFRCMVEFEQPVMRILVAEADLQRPVGSSNPEFQRYARQWVDALAAQAGSDRTLSDQARQLIPMLMSSGNCSAEHLAKYLRLDRRTVHRKLQQDGTCFSELVNEARRELAQSLVTTSTRSLGEIADMLGFAHLSGFSRWFSAEFSESPSQWRRAKAARR